MGQSEEVCPICKGKGFLLRDVPVGHPDFGVPVPCPHLEAEQRARRIAEWRSLSNLDHLARMTFDSFQTEGHGLTPEQSRNLRLNFERARRFAQAPSGWLVILGGYGCGKTHLAAAIANYRVERGEPALFVVVPDLLDHLRAAFGPDSPTSYDERFEMIRTAPLLILDDLGTESATPWAREKLFQLLNYRYTARLPTVITSNSKLEEIDARLRSRLVDPDLTVICRILAPDFRLSGSERPQADLNTLSLHAGETFESFSLRKDEFLPTSEAESLRKALDIARQFAEKPDGWLVLSGSYGCGKTHLAAAIANYRQQEKGESALFVVVPDLLDHLRAAFSPQSAVPYDKRFDEVRTAPLLILDDLGTESATPWAKEKLFQLLNYRYAARLPTVITTSSPVDEIEPRLRTRMLDTSRCRVVAILAPPYRGGLRRPPAEGRAAKPSRGKTP
jgi:DNA replication protein DnaC